MEDNKQSPAEDESDSLEKPQDGGTSLETDSTNQSGSASGEPSSPEAKNSDTTVKEGATEPLPDLSPNMWQRLVGRFNIYLFLLIILILVAMTITFVAYLGSTGSSTKNTLSTQNLTPSELQQLASNDTNVGNTGQTLNVESSAVFDGNLLARQGLQVAGNLTVGGNLALNNISVTGTAQLGQLQVSQNLAVTGDGNIQGNLTLSKNLQVSGSATFSSSVSAAQVTTGSLQLNGDLVLTHHIQTGGPIPSLKQGSALGGGGTASISGSDTSGSVSINTGSSPAAGCFATIDFSSAFSSTPYIEITPVGPSAGGLAYYITKNTSYFSICDATAPPSGSSFGFDYFVVY